MMGTWLKVDSTLQTLDPARCLGGETEAQRGETTCPRLPSQSVVRDKLELLSQASSAPFCHHELLQGEQDSEVQPRPPSASTGGVKRTHLRLRGVKIPTPHHRVSQVQFL